MNNPGTQLPLTFYIMPVIILLCMAGMVYTLSRSAQKRKAKSRGQSSAFPQRPLTTAAAAQSPSKRGIARISPASNRSSSASVYDDVAQPDLNMLVSEEEAPASPHMFSQSTEPEPPLEHDWLAALSPDPYDPQPVAEKVAPATQAKIGTLNQQRPSDDEEMVEVMRIYRTLTDGKLVIQMGNQRYRSITEMRDPDMAQRFTDTTQELMSLTGNTAGSRLKSLASSVVAATKAAPSPAAQPISPVGIVQAIEDFLQLKLATSPKFSTRSIHIKPGQNQGLRIEVDNHSYHAIGDVVDPDVREFLAGVMQEWDARH